jgi:O-antigen/teichoic acid export membrane protein
VLAIGILLVVPEVIWILGGKEYAGAIYCLPPLITSCVFQFIYTMYVNIEFYEKKTIGVALATMVATGINLALNFILIPISPENGYIIAAYTTLAGYIVLFIMHYFMVKRLGMDHVYNTKNIVIILLATLLISLVANVLYKVVLIRYTIVLIYGLGVLFIIFKKKDVLKNLIKN